MIGVLLLMGITKKNSIILVDYANVMREEGHRARPAMAINQPARAAISQLERQHPIRTRRWPDPRPGDVVIISGRRTGEPRAGTLHWTAMVV